MSNFKFKTQLILSLFAAGAVALSAAEEKKARETENSDKMKRTDVAIQEKVQSSESADEAADKLVKEANAAFSSEKFEEAKTLYLGAVAAYRKSQDGVSDIAKEKYEKKVAYCQLQIARAYRYMARNAKAQAEKLYEAKNYDEAVAMLREAQKYAPESKEELDELIARYEARRKQIKVLEDTKDETLMPDRENNEYQIALLMRQGRELARSGQYEDAMRKFQEVSLIDPFNADAIQNVTAMAARMRRAADMRTDTTRREMVAEMEWEWAVPIYPQTSSDEGNAVDAPVEKTVREFSPLQKKLISIRIPKIEFDEISIPMVISFLRSASKDNDPEGVGVNIVYFPFVPGSEENADQSRQNNPSGSSGDAESAPDTAENASPASAPAVVASSEGESTAETGPKISVLINNASLIDAIRTVCKAAKLRFRVEENAVAIAPENAVLDEMETRLFPVDPTLLASYSSSEDLQNYFQENGIRFPAGAKVKFISSISRLVATNTVENLVAIESFLETLSNKEPLVEIQAKFIEVNENDLKELGFNYSVSYNPGNDPYTMIDNPGNSDLPQVTADTFSSHRLSVGANDELNTTLSDNNLVNVSGFVRGADGLNWSATINAVNQTDSNDTLSSPRVVTLQNQEVYIEMVMETYFADTYTNGTSTINSSSNNNGGNSYASYTSVSPMPNFTDPTPLGIRMRIRPEVDLEKRTITIRNFAPVVTTFAGYTEYSSVDSSGGVNLVRKPIIDVRDIATSLTIYDGQTVVVGSVIDDLIQTVEDKYPILGDLPLVGRLFQSRGTKATKRNLLIFITCRLVKPDGSAWFPEDLEKKGKPFLGRPYFQ